jgi:hypothetical protein
MNDKPKVNYKTVTLPEREEMISRLEAVDPNPRLWASFYPNLLKHAGKEIMADNIAGMMAVAVAKLINAGYEELGLTIMNGLATRLINALVDDPEVARRASFTLCDWTG